MQVAVGRKSCSSDVAEISYSHRCHPDVSIIAQTLAERTWVLREIAGSSSIYFLRRFDPPAAVYCSGIWATKWNDADAGFGCWKLRAISTSDRELESKPREEPASARATDQTSLMAARGALTVLKKTLGRGSGHTISQPFLASIPPPVSLESTRPLGRQYLGAESDQPLRVVCELDTLISKRIDGANADSVRFFDFKPILLPWDSEE